MSDQQFQEQNGHTIEEEREATIPNVYVWGSAECDQFDLRDQDGEEQPECKRPFKLDVFQQIDIVTIACGGLHTLFLSSIGQVYGCGCNDVYVLTKREKEISDRVPAHIALPVAIDMISAGDSHSVAVNSMASLVYFWGVYKNTNGNMESPHEKPTRIGEKVFNKPIDKLLSGYNHTIILMDKRVYCWGDQDTKVLGRKSNTRHNIAQCLNPEALGAKSVIDVYTGGYHSFIKIQKKDIYQYYAWGLNNYGQLGIGNTQDVLVPTEISQFRGMNIRNITGGEHHSLALLDNGDVYSFGRNDDGQIGQDINESLKTQALLNKQKKIEELKETILQSLSKKINTKYQKELDALVNFDRVIGYEYVTSPLIVKDLPKMDGVAAAGHFSYAYNLQDQRFFSWGMGNSYVLGTREEDSVYSPFEIPHAFFREKKVLHLSLGGQHVALLTSNNPDQKLNRVHLDAVPEERTLPKLKAFRKPLQPRQVEKQKVKEITDIKIKPLQEGKRKPTATLDETVRRLKID